MALSVSIGFKPRSRLVVIRMLVTDEDGRHVDRWCLRQVQAMRRSCANITLRDFHFKFGTLIESSTHFLLKMFFGSLIGSSGFWMSLDYLNGRENLI